MDANSTLTEAIQQNTDSGKAVLDALARRLQAIRKFLESTPPGTKVEVPIEPRPSPGESEIGTLTLPAIMLHCNHPMCQGPRQYEAEDFASYQLRVRQRDERFLTFVCRNCKSTTKTFAVRATAAKDAKSAELLKFGEDPAFGPPTPEKVLKLFGSERNYFFLGRRAENQGMGIAAFAYYRRVIEAKRNELFDEIIRVAEVLKAPDAMIDDLRRARTETQFTKAIEAIKHGIPEVLYISGHNPLTLLHDTISDGLHGRTDEECLADATNIRVVLIELVEKLSQALKNDAELTSAVSAMLNRKTQRSQTPK